MKKLHIGDVHPIDFFLYRHSRENRNPSLTFFTRIGEKKSVTDFHRLNTEKENKKISVLSVLIGGLLRIERTFAGQKSQNIAWQIKETGLNGTNP